MKNKRKLFIVLFLITLFASTLVLAESTKVAQIASTACRVLAGKKVPTLSIHRGMYVSLYTKMIGDQILDSNVQNILGNTTKENLLLKFIVNQQIDSISLYDLNTIFASETKKVQLSTFIQAAKNCGIIDVAAIGAASFQWDAIYRFQYTYPNSFNTLLTEVEFWNSTATNMPADFLAFLNMLDYMRNLGIQYNGKSVKIAVYLGWLNRVPGYTADQVAAKISTKVDRVYLHCYVKSATTAYSYCQSRLRNFVNAHKTIELYPIFSAEGTEYTVDHDLFMGDWLKVNSTVKAEQIYSNSYYTEYPLGAVAQLLGFQYFEYSFMTHFLGYYI